MGEANAGARAELDGPVLRLVLDRPEKRNAVNNDMVDLFLDALDRVVASDEVRVVELTAVGPHFCSGYDLSSAGDRPGRGERPRTGHLLRSMQRRPHRLIQALFDLPLPVVAGVRGAAAGIGMALALSADFVVAAGDATFSVPFVGRGFTPDSGSTFLLPRLLGLARAKQLVLRGVPMTGQQAAEWGVITDAVPEPELDTAVAAVTEELAGAATIAVGLAKALLHENLTAGLDDALRTEALTEELAVRSDDFKEGIAAFTQRRRPEFRGR